GLAGARQPHHHEDLSGVDAEARIDHGGREAVLAELSPRAPAFERLDSSGGTAAEDLVQAFRSDHWRHVGSFVGGRVAWYGSRRGPSVPPRGPRRTLGTPWSVGPVGFGICLGTGCSVSPGLSSRSPGPLVEASRGAFRSPAW